VKLVLILKYNKGLEFKNHEEPMCGYVEESGGLGSVVDSMSMSTSDTDYDDYNEGTAWGLFSRHIENIKNIDLDSVDCENRSTHDSTSEYLDVVDDNSVEDDSDEDDSDDDEDDDSDDDDSDDDDSDDDDDYEYDSDDYDK
jgi:hypothetical protein